MKRSQKKKIAKRSNSKSTRKIKSRRRLKSRFNIQTSFDTDNHRFETIQEKEERVLRNCGSKPKFWEISKKRQYRTCRAKEMWDKKYMLRPLLKKKRSRRRRYLRRPE